MRTLSLEEVKQVSGAGTIADAASALGGEIGAVIDAINCNNNGCAEQEGKKMGLSIGQQIESVVKEHNGCCKQPKMAS